MILVIIINSYLVYMHLSLKSDEKLGRNYVMVKVLGMMIFVRPSLDAMRSHQIPHRNDWERDWK